MLVPRDAKWPKFFVSREEVEFNFKVNMAEQNYFPFPKDVSFRKCPHKSCVSWEDRAWISVREPCWQCHGTSILISCVTMIQRLPQANP